MTTTTLERSNYRTPAARRVLAADAPRDEWLAARRSGIGASEASGILGVSRWTDPYGVWAQKLGLVPDVVDNEAMYWGRAIEPLLRTRFVEDTGIPVKRSGLLRSREHSFMLYTPDGITADGGLFEAKTSTGRLAEEWEDDEVPDHANVQVHQGMIVTGRSHAYIAGLLDGRNWMVRRVERDEDLCRVIIAEEERFWVENVLGETAPPVTALSLDTIKARYGVASANPLVLRTEDPAQAREAIEIRSVLERRKAAKAAVKIAETNADTVEAELKERIGEHSSIEVDGEVLVKLKNDGTFSPKRFAEEHPDLAAKFTRTTEALDVKALAEAHPEIHTRYRARVVRPVAPKKTATKK
jgi:putative phage-type endonuclease